jgi:tRNA threonylcarbamoyladenosine biosynthesis protein TsaE
MPILREGEFDMMSLSPDQTLRLGIRLGKLLKPKMLLCLAGDMGAGKTVLTSGIGQGWGAIERVTSPTFTLVHEHRRAADKTKLYHLDCYRLKGASDLESIGFDEILDSNGIVIVEWPERILDALPKERLWLEMKVVDDTRRNISIEAEGNDHKALLDIFRSSMFKG